MKRRRAGGEERKRNEVEVTIRSLSVSCKSYVENVKRDM
jgi:hypothetical protein